MFRAVLNEPVLGCGVRWFGLQASVTGKGVERVSKKYDLQNKKVFSLVIF